AGQRLFPQLRGLVHGGVGNAGLRLQRGGGQREGEGEQQRGKAHGGLQVGAPGQPPARQKKTKPRGWHPSWLRDLWHKSCRARRRRPEGEGQPERRARSFPQRLSESRISRSSSTSSEGSSGAAGSSGVWCMRLIALTSRKIANARMMNWITALRNSPMPITTAGTASPAASTVASFSVMTHFEKSTPPISSPIGGMITLST